ncbi:uncharacterized protein METZ01_LOCUS169591 [marine metagenome]|uniref:Uncharacterized protein n=1 Tax=marine metagenome TaxID=408172 RepID=A0A382BU48_9ZZZZ
MLKEVLKLGLGLLILAVFIAIVVFFGGDLY